MPATNSGNLVIPELMRTEVNVDFAKIFDFLFQGMAERSPIEAGELVNIRGFNELTGDAERMSDGGVYSTNNVTTYKDIGVILHRIKKFGAEDLGNIVSGQDATGAIRRMIARYFARQAAARFIDVLTGVFASSGPLNLTNLSSVYVDTATAGSRIKLTPAVAATGMAKIGDNMNDLGIWLMHSATYATLLAAGYLETSPNTSAYSFEGGIVRSFMGKPVLVSDELPVTDGTNCSSYRTYLCARGSLFLGIQKDINPEYSRDTNKIDIISTDMHYCAHVRGCKWASTANPLDSDLKTATNWALAYSSAKQVRVVAIDHNV
jgi:hypothetical protein